MCVDIRRQLSSWAVCLLTYKLLGISLGSALVVLGLQMHVNFYVDSKDTAHVVQLTKQVFLPTEPSAWYSQVTF